MLGLEITGLKRGRIGDALQGGGVGGVLVGFRQNNVSTDVRKL